jgi:hypothetical protein
VAAGKFLMRKLFSILLAVFLLVGVFPAVPETEAAIFVPSPPPVNTSACGTYTVRSNVEPQDEITVGYPFELFIPQGSRHTSFTPGYYTLVYYDANGSYTTLGQAAVSDSEPKVGTFIFGPNARTAVTSSGFNNTVLFKKDISKPEVCHLSFDVTPGFEPTCDLNNSTPETTDDCGSVDTGIGNLSGNPGVLASRLLAIGIAMAGGVALIVMIVAVYKIITSRGNPESLQNGRDLFTSAVIGLLFIIFAIFILQFIGRDIIGIPGFSLQLVPPAHAAQLGEFNVEPPVGLDPGLNSIGAIISAFLPAVFALAGIAAFIYLILGGFRYLISRGDPKQIESARGAITNAMIGLIVIVGIFVIIAVIQAIFKIQIMNIGLLLPTAHAQGVDLGEAFQFGGQGVSTQFSGIGGLVSSFLTVIFPVAGIVFFFMLLWGGLKYILSRGDDKAVAAARSTITSALIGLLIIVGSFLILRVIEALTGLWLTG